MRMPSLNGVRAFEAAARHLSMRLAAAELCVTASAVSQLVRNLERELGVSLFVRRHRSLSLTSEGQALLPAVRTAIRLIGDAAERISRKIGPTSLTVTVTNFFAETWLVPRLADFHEHYPEIELRITTDGRLADLSNGDADVAIRHGLGDYPGMVSDPIVAPPLVPVAAPGLIARLGLPPAPADLLHWPLIHDADRGAWALWATHLGLADAVPAKGVSYDDPALLRAAALAGQGAALMPEPLIAPLIAAGSLRSLGPAVTMPDVAYFLVTPRAAVARAPVGSFRQWIREQFTLEETDPGDAKTP